MRWLFCAISRPEVATPPQLAALAGTEENAVLQEQPGRRQRAGHVGALGHSFHSVLDQVFGVFDVDLVLRCARESAIALHRPERVVIHLHIRGHEDRILELLDVLA